MLIATLFLILFGCFFVAWYGPSYMAYRRERQELFDAIEADKRRREAISKVMRGNR